MSATHGERMLIPMVCFTCGHPIAHLWDQYLSLVKYFKFNQLGTGTETQHTPEFWALAELNITRDCCRRMFLTQPEMF